MIILPTLKHNKFEKVDIPRASELVKVYGLTKKGVNYSGDEYLAPDASKIDNVAEVARDAFEEAEK